MGERVEEEGPSCPQGAHTVICEASSRVTDVLVCLEQPNVCLLLLLLFNSDQFDSGFSQLEKIS